MSSIRFIPAAVIAAALAFLPLTAAPAEASPLSDCVVRSANDGYTVSSSVDYCSQFYSPTATKTVTVTSTATSTKTTTATVTRTAPPPVYGDDSATDWDTIAAITVFVVVAIVVVGGWAIRRNRRTPPPAHAVGGYQPQPVAPVAEPSPSVEYLPPPSYAAAEPEPKSPPSGGGADPFEELF